MLRTADFMNDAAEVSQEIDSLLEGEPTGNGSLMRLRYLAYSIPFARRIRKTLWGSIEPLFSAEDDDESLAKALERVWTWVQDSPKVKRYETTFSIEVNADGSETKSEEFKIPQMPIDLPKWVESRFVEEALPLTRRAYDLSDAVRSLTNKSKSLWWRPSWTAVYLTTGKFKRVALPRFEATSGLRVVGSKSRGYAHIKVHDMGSVSPSEVADAYKRARQEIAEWIGDIPRFNLTAGRPEEYASEILAQLELELILEKADERFARGESVRPELWTYRPGQKALADAWMRKARSLGIETDKVPSKQSISGFQSRVGRDLYEAVLRDMWTEDDNKREAERAHRNDRLVREAHKQALKK